MGGERPKGEGAKAEDGKRRKIDGIRWKLWFCKGCKVPMPIDGIYQRTPYLSIAVTRSLDGKSVSQVMKQF